MQLNEKLRFMRQIKKWSQEEAAYRLNISPSAYGSIERGETKLSLPRLEEIAKLFEIELTELIDFTEKQVLNFGSIHGNNCQNWCSNPSSEQFLELQHELEKTRLLLQERDKEISYLKEDKERLKEIIALLKNR